MKKLYSLLTVVMIIFIASACSDKKKKDEGINHGMPNITIEKPISTNIIVGENKNNIPLNQPSKSPLFTTVFFMPEQPNDDITLTGTYSIIDPNALEPVNIIRHSSTSVLFDQADNNKYANNLERNYMMKTLPASIKIGTKWDNINVLRKGQPVSINAVCVGESKYAYIFEEADKKMLTPKQIEEITANFDRIYTTNREIFGPDTDTDGYSKIILLFTDLDPATYGYFSQADKDSAVKNSNGADMLYLNLNEVNKQPNGLKLIFATMAHEFQHMIRHDYRKAKGLNPIIAPWIDEGLSMLAEYYNGYTFRQQGLLEQFIDNAYNLSLIKWTDLNYGYSMAFFMYLNERFGKDFIKGIYDSADTGVVSVANSIKKDSNFNYLYQDFVYMILVSGRNINKEARYNMKTLDIKTAVDKVYAKYSTQPDDAHTATLELGMAPYFDMYPYSFNLVKWLDQVTLFEYESAEKLQGYMESIPSK